LWEGRPRPDSRLSLQKGIHVARLGDSVAAVVDGGDDGDSDALSLSGVGGLMPQLF